MNPNIAGGTEPAVAPATPATPPTTPEPRPGFRIEKDPLGYLEVPSGAYYGVQTARGIHNFPISGALPHPALVRAIVQVKKAAARANMATGRLPKQLGNAIVTAADEVLEPLEEPGRATDEATAGDTDAVEACRPADPMHAAFAAAHAARQRELIDNFRIDPFQAGAGTSHNMNANEVLANRAIELLHAAGVGSGARGDYAVVSPNDHVNMAQSTNDVFPTAMRIATLDLIRDFMPAAEELIHAFERKAAEFDDVIKSGRTHMQDAVPIRLGQEFAAYALTLRRGVERLQAAAQSIAEQNIGATAVGTGLNAEPEYIELVLRNLAEQTGHPLRGAEHLVQATHSMRPMLEVSAALRGIAVDLIKISEDLRLMSSGPMTGFAEITLPAVQPGSSIMPGKVNPVMAECLSMVCFRVIGNDTTIAWAASAGQLELNVMMPVIAHTALESLTILTNMSRAFAEFCVTGIEANRERARDLMERSSALSTPLAPYLGYALAAEISKQAVREGRTIREIVIERGIFTSEDLDALLAPHELTEPGVAGGFRFTPKLPEGYKPPTGPVGAGG
ncbi:MAG: aspartate ammonia-lyase [Candidatus Limnocylindrales bacterium]|jgi:aspartate ammonia-lyase